MPENDVKKIEFHRETVDLFGRSKRVGEAAQLLYKMTNPTYGSIKKELVDKELATSSQTVDEGIQPWPLDIEAAVEFQSANEHHSACLHTKTLAISGLGTLTQEELKFRRHLFQMKTAIQEGFDQATVTKMFLEAVLGEEISKEDAAIESLMAKADEILNPLCVNTWQETLWDATEDFVQTGNGYLEIVRSDGDAITGIHHLPAPDVRIYVEDEYGMNFHYDIRGGEYKFARFGDKDDFVSRFLNSEGGGGSDEQASVSEVIHFRRPTSRSRWYGYPDWVAAVASIELVQMVVQYNFDFFLNRGVPEMMILFTGQKLDSDDWKVVEDSLRGCIGQANSHKSIALNLATNENFELHVEKLGSEDSDEDRFATMRENLSLGIVSAHRVPPILAGIQIPGKLGAVNEMSNNIMAFQTLVISPLQRLFQQTLGSTLGNPELNGGLGLTQDDFTFRRITEAIDVGTMDTVARMRQSPMQAAQEGRKLEDGVKE